MVRRPPSIRPKSVTFTVYLVFLLGVINGWRVVALWQQTTLLRGYEPSLDPRGRLVVSLMIAVVSVWFAAALWRKKPFTRHAIPLLWSGCALYRMVLLGVWVQSPVARQGWAGEMVVYAAAILYTTWALNRRPSQPYFSEQ